MKPTSIPFRLGIIGGVAGGRLRRRPYSQYPTTLNSKSPRLFLVLLVVGMRLWAEPPAAPALTWHAPSDPAVAPAVAQAKVTIAALVGTLLPAVNAAVEVGGPPQGVILCHGQAEPLTQQTRQQAGPSVTGLKRTSLRVRNPANAPDRAEQAALDRVAALLAAGKEPPPLLVQYLAETPDHPAELRVYRSMTVAANCLACHGDPASFTPQLRDSLRTHYPQDTATGYAEGDWRGLIRVSLQP